MTKASRSGILRGGLRLVVPPQQPTISNANDFLNGRLTIARKTASPSQGVSKPFAAA